MTSSIYIEPLTSEAFKPYGDVIDAKGDPTVMGLISIEGFGMVY